VPRTDLVIFDCDGVLVDSEVLSCECLALMLSRYGLPMDVAQVYETFLGRGFSSVAAYWGTATGTPLPEQFAGELRESVEAAFSESLKPIPGVEQVLDQMRIPYCLASSSSPERIAHSLAVTRLGHYFEGKIFSASMVERAKPAPDLFLLAASRMGAEPLHSLVIEDSVNGVLAGKAAGMRVWGFVGGSHHASRAAASSLAEAGADRILASMHEFDLV
jgi:HAD superfamily hydrolase (TIGR01509 family)